MLVRSEGGLSLQDVYGACSTSEHVSSHALLRRGCDPDDGIGTPLGHLEVSAGPGFNLADRDRNGDPVEPSQPAS